MPNLYDAALMLIRVFAASNLVIGVSALAGVALIALSAIAAGTHQPPDVLLGVLAYLADFGCAATLGGIALLLLSKRIARFASKN
jgi:hypothetical protein